MKTIVTLLAATMLMAGASSAMAYDQQATDDALDTAISHQVSHSFGGAFASARIPGEVRNSTVSVPSQDDFQLQGR